MLVIMTHMWNHPRSDSESVAMSEISPIVQHALHSPQTPPTTGEWPLNVLTVFKGSLNTIETPQIAS